MKREEFKNWLINIYKDGEGMVEGSAEKRVSNAQKVEVAFGDLDNHFQKDFLKSIKENLTYSKDDARSNASLPIGLVIDGDYYTGLATLRQSIKRYIEFKNF